MSKAIKTGLSLVASLALFSSLAMAQASGYNADKDKNKEHHSRLAKAAFWRHHKDSDKNAKPAQATQALSKQTPTKQAPSKQAQVKPAQMKSAPAKQASAKQGSKPAPHTVSMSKSSANKAPAAKKTKPAQKAQDLKTVSSKQ
jgi:hypothetical protein